MAIFVIFFAYFGQNLVAMATPLDPCNQKCLLWIGRPRKPHVICNHLLVISRRNEFICIYNNFSSKIGCHGNTPLYLVYGSVIDEFAIAQTLHCIPKPNSALMCCIQLKLCSFLCFLAYFGRNLAVVATFLRPLQSQIFYLGWSTTKAQCYK